jgi:hypothetical protein
MSPAEIIIAVDTELRGQASRLRQEALRDGRATRWGGGARTQVEGCRDKWVRIVEEGLDRLVADLAQKECLLRVNG